MAQNGHFGAITGSVGSELVEQCGIKVEQVRAHLGQCNGTVSLVKGGLWAYMQKAGDSWDISPQFFLDFPQNFRLRT